MFNSLEQNFMGREVNMNVSAQVSEDTMKQLINAVSREFKPEKELVDLHDEIDHVCQGCSDITCIYWKDGTKTSVECQEDDEYKRELGIVWAIAEKAMGGKENLHNLLAQYPEDEEDDFEDDDFDEAELFEDEFEIGQNPFGGGKFPLEAILGLALLPILLGGKDRY